MRTGDELRERTTGHVSLENFIRIVEVGNNDVELGEVIREFGGQFPVARKEARQTARLNRLCPIHQPARERQPHDVRVAENFEMRPGKLPPQRRDGRQRENEITDRAAANYENL